MPRAIKRGTQSDGNHPDDEQVTLGTAGTRRMPRPLMLVGQLQEGWGGTSDRDANTPLESAV